MGKIIIQGNSGGGADPDEISARASDVLKGKTTIDSDGEVVEGGIDDRGSYAECKDIAVGSHDMNLYFLGGYYKHRTDGTRPTLVVEFEQLRNKLGIDASKMLEGYSLLGVSGSIPFRGHGLIDDKKASGNFNIVNNYADIDIQNIPEGYYKKDSSYSWSPAVRVPLQKLLDYLGVDTSKMLSTLTIANRQGSIPISRTNKNHVKTMDIGHVWGDDRGLLYVIRVDEGYYIPPVSQGGYAYVGVSEPDLRPENIREGVSIGRVRGTLIDPLAGGSVFHNATFYGLLRGGLASTRPSNFKIASYDKIAKNLVVNSGYRFGALATNTDLGFTHQLYNYEVWDVSSTQSLIYVFRNSINLAYFNNIQISATINYDGVYIRPSISAGFFSVYDTDVLEYQKTTQRYFSTRARRLLSVAAVYNGKAVIDVSNVNEHGFFYISFAYEIDRGNPPALSNIHMRIDNIVFNR